MPVQNRIVKVQKRNRALVHFDEGRIAQAILRAARSVGGFSPDFIPGVNEKVFEAHPEEEQIATFLAEAVVVGLNANAHHLIANFPPTIENIQDGVLHALRSYGFQSTADAYECYRWGRHWLREGALTPATFVGNGFPQERMAVTLDWCQEHDVHTVAGLNEAVHSGNIKEIGEEALDLYEQSLDEAAEKVLTRLNHGDSLRMIWVSGPSSSGKTTTTVKLMQRLEQRGLRFLMLNLDDYFWSLVEHPTDWINDRNYETPEALDIQLLNQHLQALLAGHAIEKPVYSFKQGRRTGTKLVKLEADQILLLDCLHGFYPPINEGIEPGAQFRLYIETQFTLFEGDGQTKRLTKFTDVRMLRRMLRDARHRNHSALRTVLHWHYVRTGELFCILPLQGLADHVLNGGFPFDLPALKPFFAGPDSLLPREDDFREYAGFLDAKIRFHRVKALLDSVEGFTMKQVADHRLIPGDAIIREFIGGSTIPIPHNE
jgi:uridine kinase